MFKANSVWSDWHENKPTAMSIIIIIVIIINDN